MPTKTIVIVAVLNVSYGTLCTYVQYTVELTYPNANRLGR